MGPLALRNTGRMFDGWMPTATSPEAFALGYQQVLAAASEAGRKPGDIATAAYLTVNVDPDPNAAREQTERYAQEYYGIPFDVISRVQGYHVGLNGCAEWLNAFTEAGVGHLVVRFATTDVIAQLERFTDKVRPALA